MLKSEIIKLTGKELLERLENSFKQGKITRIQANEVYRYWINNSPSSKGYLIKEREDDGLYEEAVKVFGEEPTAQSNAIEVTKQKGEVGVSI